MELNDEFLQSLFSNFKLNESSVDHNLYILINKFSENTIFNFIKDKKKQEQRKNI